tara:strand:+ start:1964 stop:2209 length:246 start_codon:yes stop_codon:yes gene_type:complete
MQENGIVSQATKPKVLRPRYWCVRIPSDFCGNIKLDNVGGFQTVVMAYDNHNAFVSALGSDEWEMLPFKVTNIMVFPTKAI